MKTFSKSSWQNTDEKTTWKLLPGQLVPVEQIYLEASRISKLKDYI
jgi:hypothetical protein